MQYGYWHQSFRKRYNMTEWRINCRIAYTQAATPFSDYSKADRCAKTTKDLCVSGPNNVKFLAHAVDTLQMIADDYKL